MKHNQQQKAHSHRPRIKKGDTVMVITGNDKGETGRVLEVYPKENRVLVEGIRVAKVSRKSANRQVAQGGIHEREMPIHLSNVMLVDPKDGTPTRLGVRYEKRNDGTTVRIRYAKGSNTDLKD